MSAPPLRRGDVRVRGGLAAYNTSIEVWDGAAWLRLQGVTSIFWSIEGPETLPELRLGFRGVVVDLLTPNERTALEIVREPKEGKC